MPFPTGWTQRCALRINSSKVSGTQTNFPVFLRWTGSSVTSNLPVQLVDARGNSALAGGEDIRFSSDLSGANQLAFEIVTFQRDIDPAVARAEIHVKVPSLSSSADTIIYLWWGNPSATALPVTDTYGRNAVWSAVYSDVFHMDGSGNAVNSVGNYNDATNFGSTMYESGMLGYARQFVPNSYMQINRLISTNFSISFWMWADTTSNTGSQWWQGNGLVDGEVSGVVGDFGVSYLNNRAVFGTGVSDITLQPTKTVSDGTMWHYIVATRDSTNGGKNIYIDGVADGTQTGSTGALTAPSNLKFGSLQTLVSGCYFTGKLDEIRIAPSVLSSSWITTEYNSQVSPQTFVTVSSPESPFPIGWARRCALTINSGRVFCGTLTNFPVTLVWTGNSSTSNLPIEMFDTKGISARSDGGDVRFSSDSEGVNQLPFEIVSFSTSDAPSTVKAEIHVSVPSISSSADTIIYLWWGNPSATALPVTDTYGRNAVWSSYKFVGHMDSTQNAVGDGNDLIRIGTTSFVSGLIGNAISLDGTTGRLVSGSVGISGNSSRTVSLWMKPNTLNRNGLVNWGTNVINGEFGVSLRSGWFLWGFGAGNDYDPGGDATVGIWNYVSVTHDGTVACFYVDGTKIGPDFTHSFNTTDSTVNFGYENDLGLLSYFDGALDEVRIKASVDSSCWIRAMYNSQSSPQTFVTVGTSQAMFPIGWKRRSTLRIDYTKVTGDRTYFKLYLVWTGNAATSNLPIELVWDACNKVCAKPDGRDIRFSLDPQGMVQLPFEIVTFGISSDPSTVKAEIWVNVPSVSSASYTDLYIWWGNDYAQAYGVTEPYGRNSLWDTGWEAVYHMNGTSTLTDALGRYDGTNYGSIEVDGKLGKARYFSDTDPDYISIPSLLGSRDRYVLMAWVNWNPSAYFSGEVISIGDSVALRLTTSGIYGFYRYSGGWRNTIDTNNILNTGWNFVAYATNPAGSSPRQRVFLNGNQTITSDYTDAIVYDLGTTTEIGRHGNGSTFFYGGSIDEVRVAYSSTFPNNTYFSTNYNSQNSPETFVLSYSPVHMNFPTGWERKCKIIQNKTKVSEDQTNFPSVLVWTGSQATSNLPQEMFDKDGGSAAQPNGNDVRFTLDQYGNIQLPFEIVNFSTNNDPSQARAEIHVKLPSVSSSKDTPIWVWYKNPDTSSYVPSDTYGSYNVWNDYRIVYHLNENISTNPIDLAIGLDATSSGAALTSVSSITISHTIGANLNRALIVGISYEDATSNVPAVSSVTYNGINLQQIDQTFSTIGYSSLWYMGEEGLPRTAGTYDIITSFDRTVTGGVVVGAVSLYNVRGGWDSSAKAITTSGNTLSYTITTTTNNSWIIDNISCGNTGSYTCGVLQTERWDRTGTSMTGAGSTRLVTTAGAVTSDWTHSGANRQILVAAAFAPAQVAHDSAGIIDNTGYYSGYNFPNRTYGLWGYGQQFFSDRTNNIKVSNVPDVDITGNMHVALILKVNTDASTGWRNVAAIFARGQQGYRVRRNGGTDYIGFTRYTSDGTYLAGDGTLVNVADNNYHYILYNFDTTSGAQLYIDATVNCFNSDTRPTQSSVKNLSFGWNEDSTALIYGGFIDEIRVAAMRRSASWVTTEYNSLMSPHTFWSLDQPSLTYPHTAVVWIPYI